MEIITVKKQLWKPVLAYVLGSVLYIGACMLAGSAWGDDLSNLVVQAKENESRALTVFTQLSDKEDKISETIRTNQCGIEREKVNLSALTGQTNKLHIDIDALISNVSKIDVQLIPAISKRTNIENNLVILNKNLSDASQFAKEKQSEEKDAQFKVSTLTKTINGFKNQIINIARLTKEATGKEQSLNIKINILTKSLVDVSKEYATKTDEFAKLKEKEEYAKSEASKPLNIENEDFSKMTEAEIRLSLQESTKKQQEIQDKREQSVRVAIESRIKSEKAMNIAKEERSIVNKNLENAKDDLDATIIEKQELGNKLEEIKAKLVNLDPQLIELNKLLNIASEKARNAELLESKARVCCENANKELSNIKNVISGLEKQKTETLTLKKKTEDNCNSVTGSVDKMIIFITKLETRQSELVQSHKDLKKSMIDAEKYYRKLRVDRIKAEVELKVESDQTPQVISMNM